MAAVRGGKLVYLLSNFASTLANQTLNINKSRLAFFHYSSFLFGKGQKINMPSLSPTMLEGKIVKWLKKEGDTINSGDVLCDIETDKAIVSMETEEEGILAKIIVPENSGKIKVGSLIALMVLPGEDWKNVEVPASTAISSFDSESSSPSSSDFKAENEVQKGSGPSTILVNMPSLSPTMTSGKIVKWLKKEGDTVAPGDVLCDIQTDKAVMSLESEEEGILAKIVVPSDSLDVEVGTLIAVVVPEGEDWKSVDLAMKSCGEKREKSQFSSVPVEAPEVRRKSFGPAVKVMLSSYQLEPGLIKPTGRDNRLLKEDVLNYIKNNNLERKPPKTVSAPIIPKSIKKPESVASLLQTSQVSSVDTSKYKDFELSAMRQTIAKRLMQSKLEIPHYYSIAKCNVDNLIKSKEVLSVDGIKLSINDFLTKAVALSLQMYPKANAVYVNNEVKPSGNVDICVTLANDVDLFTPVIKAANKKSVVDISEEISELAVKVRNGNLKPEEIQGGTFTISNLGMFGITHFKAIINPPHSGILAVGSTIESLSPDLVVEKHMILSLSCDRRILQEEEAAEFMQVLKHFIENPKLITLDVKQSIEMRL